MSPIGQRKNELLGRAPALVVAACAAASTAWMRGFSVDDAWIIVRYARNIASGAGHRFNAEGPITDGVTPLVYPWLLAPLAHASPHAVFLRARLIGAAAWTVAAWLLASRIWKSRAAATDKIIASLTVVLSVPFAAHAVSGMETGLTTALATAAACMLHRPLAAAALAGGAVALRPELAPWATSLAFGSELVRARGQGIAAAGALPRAALVAFGALAPFFATAFLRLVVFGRPAPLALIAKPSDLSHGLVYSAAAVAVVTPVLAFAPIAIARTGGRAVVVACAMLAHVVAVVVAGGDWMPYARLFVPVAPSLALVAVEIAPASATWSRALRGVLALGIAAFMLFRAAPEGRHVVSDRRALAERAKPFLEHARVVAALDIGWPTSVFDGSIVDLAGLTDPVIARLPGGHTSKKVDAALLLDRKPDVLLFFAESTSSASPESARYPRVVEARLAHDDLVRLHYTPRVFLPLVKNTGYVVWTRTD